MLVQFASLAIIALAVSLDSFSVGITYGLRRMRLPFLSIMVIACCSSAMILVATGVARGLAASFSPEMAERLGGLILIGLGFWGLYQVVKEDGISPSRRNAPKKIQKKMWKLELKRVGIVIQVLRSPLEADMDRSGAISGLEAVLLGLALSLDAFGAGVGAGLIGFAPWLTALSIGVMSSLFLYLGMISAPLLIGARWTNRVAFLPALVLITIGLWKMY